MGVRYQKYQSIAIPLGIDIELSQVSRYFDISNIEPALIPGYDGMCVMSPGSRNSGCGKGFVGEAFSTRRPLTQQLPKLQIQLYNNINMMLT